MARNIFYPPPYIDRQVHVPANPALLANTIYEFPLYLMIAGEPTYYTIILNEDTLPDAMTDYPEFALSVPQPLLNAISNAMVEYPEYELSIPDPSFNSLSSVLADYPSFIMRMRIFNIRQSLNIELGIEL